MGKYMRKSKPTCSEIALIDLSSSSSSLGVRTRAKTRTLALQGSDSGSGSYLQLRSRRLHKPPVFGSNSDTRKPKNHTGSEPNLGVEAAEMNDNVGVEASFGENCLEFDARERSTRESTPCSLISPDAVKTPGSSNRPTNSTDRNRTLHNSTRRHIPTAHEMEEFFAEAELQQQQQFIDKYNFDPVNDKPLPGNFDWEKINP